MINQFVSGLKSRNEETRTKTAKNLQHYVTTELREMSQDERTSFMDELNHHIFELVSSQDVNEKKGGIMAIVSLISIDSDNANRITRFANYLRILLPSNDVAVMEMAAKAIGRLAMAGGTFTPEYVEFEVRRALEWLGGDRNEGRRHAAVLVLRELAENTPTFFFQQVQSFFDHIFNAVRDPKQSIREAAVAALRACLELTSQRETKEMQKPQWYKQTYEEAEKGFEEVTSREKGLNRDDRVHGSLLIVNELIRNSSMEGERLRQEMEEVSHQQSQHEHSFKEFSGSSGSKSKFHILTAGIGHSLQHSQRSSSALSSLVSPNLVQQKPRFVESRYCRELMESKFDEVCQQVLKYRNSRSPLIQQTLLTLIPRLAAFQPTLFVSHYLDDSVQHLLSSLRRERERSSAFQAVGLLSVAVKHEIMPHLPNILAIVKSALPHKDYHNKKHKTSPVDPSVFTCISMLARAVGSNIYADVKDILEPMLAVGLSPALTASLHDLAQQIPHLKKDIQDGLLKMLSLVLMNKPLKHPGTPKGLMSPGVLAGSNQGGTDFGDITSTVLALQTLGSFDFEGHSLTQFVRHCADHFLSSEHKEIRAKAARTCAQLLQPSINLRSNRPHPVSTTNIQVVADVLSKLLVVAITDSDPDIRYCVLASLDDRFDGHLAQAENLGALFVALHDEIFEIRELAMCTIGRLSNLNPAFVMPSLRKTLIQILTELEHSGVGRNKEQSARMLAHLVSNAPRLIRPYMEPILKALIPKLKEADPNPSVVINVLAAIGEQAQVSGIEMRKWMDELCPIILDMLQDSASLRKREVALWTLGQLVESTGSVVHPYKKYSNLLDVLLNFLKTEQSPNIRRETIRVLGLLGALDPYKHKVNQGFVDSHGEGGAALSISEVKIGTEGEYTASEMLVNMGSATLEEFYPAVAIATLMRIMRDSSLANHHTGVVQGITFIFKSLGVKCVQFLPQIMPTYLNVIRTSDAGIREFLFQQLGIMISIVKQHIRNYLDDIFDLIRDFWTVNSPLQNTVIQLVEQTVVALGGEFKLYLPRIVPQMLRVFMHDNSQGRMVTTKLLKAMQKFGANLDDYLHLLLPPVVKLFDSNDIPMPVKRTALETIDLLCGTLDFTDFASRIIHPLVRSLDTTPELRIIAMDTLASLVLQLGKKYQIFVPMVNKVLVKHRISHQKYETLVLKIIKGNSIAEDEILLMRTKAKKATQKDDGNAGMEPVSLKKLHVKTNNLTKAWAVTRRVSRDDWVEWLRRLSVELLKESPSHALRSCWALAQAYNTLARDLFNAAFVSCWSELTETDQDGLIQSLQKALTSQDIPEIVQILLNLAEFMEHSDKGPLPLNTILLGECASKCRAYAKALHYKEEEFNRGPNTEILEALISINNKLHQPEAAYGVLQYAMKNYINRAELQIQETWYEKLHDWDNALAAYEKKQKEDPEDFDLTIGRMRCMEALGDWRQLHDLACERWPMVSDDGRQQMARMAAAAAWGLGNWDSMEEYSCLIPRESYDGAFYRAVLAVHQDHFGQAQQCIDKARDILDTELTAMAGESYDRAYGAMVSAQMLSELEEIIRYKLVSERRDIIKQMWWDRLQGCQRNVEDWQRIIQVRSLVINPQDDLRTWLKYASLCRKTGRMQLSHKTLVMLLGVDPKSVPDTPFETLTTVKHPRVVFAYLKHMWKEDKQSQAFEHLHHFVHSTLTQHMQGVLGSSDEAERRELQTLMARCYLKLGEWQQSLEETSQHTIEDSLVYFSKATEHDRDWYKAWHSWAFMNYEATLYYKNQPSSAFQVVPAQPSSSTPKSKTDEEEEEEGEGPTEEKKGEDLSETSDELRSEITPHQQPTTTQMSHIEKYAVPAVQGFFRSISLSRGNSLQDTLRLLTLWFDYGQCSDVYDALVEGIKSIQIDTWLQVIPQLIARIDTPRQLVGRLIHQLLMDIGKQHPQALIYPLTVASKSQSTARHNAANKVLKNMCDHSNTLVQQAMMVSEELIRVAILWHELWHEGLEEASRLYFGERNVKGMFGVLEPLHAMMERGPQTMKETSFNQAYGRDLMEAQEWCRKYTRSRNVKDLTQAWDLYYHVFRRISKQLPQLTQLELQLVSPKLLMCRDLELAVPGTYNPNRPIVRIQRVQSSLQVITSKQRPRKLSIFGSDGAEYMYLLKGHEDLRQDERVMQLFGLVNTLLANNPDTFRRHLNIQRYSIIPLSTNSGLIGWLRHCDTLHTLIRDYRDKKKKILLNIEHRIMLRMAPDYEHLTLMQKVEVFEHALEHTQGDDLAKLLWLKSPSSEVWFERRTNYTRSLAVMSMVGYILGLGDRHPSNLMLDRMSGKIIHIDFGDCFEVAMTREKFPEKIPFRLTRMLINAMEVTGIDGNYRITCASLMQVLREHKDSIMAVLEAFVYDPLLNWRLMDTAPKAKRSKARSDSFSSSQNNADLLDDVNIDTPKQKKAGEAGSLQSSDIEGAVQPEALNKKAISIINRVRDKLTGCDFAQKDSVDVAKQVELLIQQATSHENLCQCYIGWCPFW
ncbi:serine/threonine-protein kinase mTOR-like isoform X2 [Asterias amurensis]|uniref:serine/threonine-protein kinase mTOR-like isoform X2 n=1 Tax=Asterias amurensis TaxID=7602 RepID=UPI003AB1779D